MSENVEKKPGFEKKMTREVLLELRGKIRGLGGITHYEKARRLGPEFPLFSGKTLVDYSRMLSSVCDEVFQTHLDGKLSLTALAEFSGLNEETQKYIAKEYVTRKLTPSILRIAKQQKREHDMGWEEALGRATGEISIDKPRKQEEKRNLDQILTEIADKGARWRALVSMAIEMVGEEEAAAGVHRALFEKVAILRELVGNQYDMVNGRFNRYMNIIKSRLRKAVQGETEQAEEIVDVEAEVVEKPQEPRPEESKPKDDGGLVDE